MALCAQWPDEALLSVSRKFLAGTELGGEEVRDGKHCLFIKVKQPTGQSCCPVQHGHEEAAAPGLLFRQQPTDDGSRSLSVCLIKQLTGGTLQGMQKSVNFIIYFGCDGKRELAQHYWTRMSLLGKSKYVATLCYAMLISCPRSCNCNWGHASIYSCLLGPCSLPITCKCLCLHLNCRADD
eukprot:1158747-Pelagomonas_calceolata.AAC.10